MYKELTPEEEVAWINAQRPVADFSIYDYQMGLFKHKPDEIVAYKKAVKQTILSFIPVTSDQYDEAHKQGYPIEQFYPFPPALNAALQNLEGSSRWRGLTTHLGESAVGQVMLRQRLFWNEVTNHRDTLVGEENIIEAKFAIGGISSAERKKLKSDLSRSMFTFVDQLKLSPDYKDIPIDYDARIAYAQKNKTNPVIRGPLEELVAYYFERTPDMFMSVDPETSLEGINWTAYFQWRSTIENAVPARHRDEFIKLTRKWDTPMDTFERNDQEQYIQPYKNLTQSVLEEYNAETEQPILREFMKISSDGMRSRAVEDLRGFEREAGVALIANFQLRLTFIRKRYRLADPATDARLLFWSEGTSSVLTKAAEAKYEELFDQYSIKQRDPVTVTTFSPLTPDPTRPKTPEETDRERREAAERAGTP